MFTGINNGYVIFFIVFGLLKICSGQQSLMLLYSYCTTVSCLFSVCAVRAAERMLLVYKKIMHVLTFLCVYVHEHIVAFPIPGDPIMSDGCISSENRQQLRTWKIIFN